MKVPKSSGNQHAGSGANNKYTNNDLPEGATDDNAWRWLFISSLAHFAAGYDNPWSIPDNKFRDVLQEIWNTVYQDKVEHSVVVGGPVYRLVSTNLAIYTRLTLDVSVVLLTLAGQTRTEQLARRVCCRGHCINHHILCPRCLQQSDTAHGVCEGDAEEESIFVQPEQGN